MAAKEHKDILAPLLGSAVRPTIPEPGRQRQAFPGVWYSAILVEWTSSRFTERPCLKS